MYLFVKGNNQSVRIIHHLRRRPSGTILARDDSSSPLEDRNLLRHRLEGMIRRTAIRLVRVIIKPKLKNIFTRKDT